MFVLKSIINLFLIISLIVCCVSSSNLYSISSSTSYPYGNQILNIFDPLSPGIPPQSINININYQVISIISISDPNNIILLCSNNENGDNTFLIQYSINNNKTIELSSLPTNAPFGLTGTTVSFSEKVAYLVVVASEKNFISVASLNFEKEQSSIIQVSADGYTDQYVVQGFDYSNNILYLGYVTELGSINVVSINVTASQPNTTVNNFTNIQGVGATQIDMIFVDSNSNFYLLAPNSDLAGLCSACKVVNQGQAGFGCTNVLNSMSGGFTPFNGLFVSNDHQSLVFISPNQYALSYMTLTTIGINSGFDSVSFDIPNVWADNLSPIWASVAY